MIYLALDEAGHGSIAGPMTIGVIETTNTFYQDQLWDLGVCDSKLTTEELRADLFNVLKEVVTVHGLIIPVRSIDDYKHNQAFDLTVKTFISDYEEDDTQVFIDGLRKISDLNCKATYLVNGDLYHPLIAAASIVAKHTHDLEITNLANKYPEWNFHDHRGYPIPEHVATIIERKPIPGVHKLNPTYTSIHNFCKKNSLKVPEWAETKENLKTILWS